MIFFNCPADVSPVTAKAVVSPVLVEERRRGRNDVEHSGSDEPAPNKSRASRRPRNPPSGKNDASPIPRRFDDNKNAAERYIEETHCPFCWHSKKRAYKDNLSGCKHKLKQRESINLAYTRHELCYAVEQDTSSESSDTSTVASVFDGKPTTTDRVSSLSMNPPTRQSFFPPFKAVQSEENFDCYFSSP